ncbi:MAG: hypothetical protein IKL09_05545 [Clostridia bacterium]|nr:hypothetical protein [Clostridia bacterium]
MERFARRKIKVFDYLNCYRVFYCEDSGKKYFVGDYNTKNIDFIAHDVKLWYDKRKKKGKYHIVTVDLGLRSPVTDTKEHIKYFETINDADDWIDKHIYAGLSFKYEVVADENDN